ncbi:hypothetical protein [Desulfopila sp. IMCC35008]|uniref:hypothetical protein n=1 Tax=Desulfopila sp. IMCC35008 TaxID=2653858 RepID=UPI0013D11950|nr:hypothetical protein [Desulfopila sp. IMCC35008]
MVWIRRSIFTYRFKGRARRGLFWRKRVYELWFEYARQSTRSVPEEFGDLSTFKSFEEWWRHPEYGFELFCEPVEEPSVQIVNSIEDNDPGHIYLKVNLNEEPQKLKFQFAAILKKQQSNKRVEKKSNARFKPSVRPKAFKIDALRSYLEIWKLRQSDYSRKEAYEKYYNRICKEGDEDALRNISRACQRVNEIFINIERGTFP